MSARRRAVCLAVLLWGLLCDLAAAASTAPFVLDLPTAGSSASSLWTDGHDLLVAAYGPKVAVVRRGAAPQVQDLSPWKPMGQAGVISGSGSGDAAVVVLGDEDGRVARFQGGRWRQFSPPPPPSSSSGGPYRGFGDAVVDGAGRVYRADAAALYVLDGDQWHAYAWPSEALRCSFLALGVDGDPVLANAGGVVLRFHDGIFAEQRFPERPEIKDRRQWSAFWYSAGSDTLWVAETDDWRGRPRLLALSLAHGTVRVHPMLLPAEINALRVQRLRGVATPGADLLIITDMMRFLRLVDPRLPVRALAADSLFTPEEPGGRVHRLHDWERGVQISLTGDGEDFLLLPAEDAVYTLRGLTLQRAPLQRQPAALAERARRASRPGSLLLPTLRLGLGPTWRLSPDEGTSSFYLEVVGGLFVEVHEFRKHVQLLLMPELLYGHAFGDPYGVHRVEPGLAVALGNLYIAGGYGARAVIPLGGAAQIGVRHGLLIYLLASTLTIELSHQVLLAGQQPTRQDVQLIFGLNPLLPLVGAFAIPLVTAVPLALLKGLFGR